MIEENFSGDSSSEENEITEPVKKPVLSTPSDEQKQQVSTWVKDGMGLSDIQKKINDDFGIVMTYIDVRFLVDDLNLDLIDEEEEKVEVPEDSEDNPSATEQAPSPEDPLDGTPGGVQVELDTVTPPGAMASGSVTFSDGQQKKWTLDQFGRLGLSGGDEGYKPSDEDVMEFQKQLDSALRGKGF
jgi:hypothetical protein